MSKLKLKGIGPFLPGRDVQWAFLMISPPELNWPLNRSTVSVNTSFKM